MRELPEKKRWRPSGSGCVPSSAMRGVINGSPIDLDKHLGGRCLEFVRDGGFGEYRVCVLADWGEDLTLVTQ